MLFLLFVAVRNDRKIKKEPLPAGTAGAASASAPNNNNIVAKTSAPINLLTDKDQQLIVLILDAHRSTLPGGPCTPHFTVSAHGYLYRMVSTHRFIFRLLYH